MTFSDWSRFILVILIFMCLHAYIILAIQMDNIKKNWPVWKCNPMVMPFAGVFGHDEFENFTQCIQTMQSDYMKYLLQPVNLDLSLITNMGTTFTDGLSGGFDMITNIRELLTDIFRAIYGAFFQLIVQFQLMIINIKDVFGKITAVISILYKIITGIGTLIKSIDNGPPGDVMRMFSNDDPNCFHPDTKVMTYSGKLIPMKDIELNTKLKNGSTVLSVMRISNLDSDGNINSPMYEIESGEDNGHIYVTGSHLVYDPKLKEYVNVENLEAGDKCKLSTKECRELTCLITSDHTIAIGDWIFHDWEDNNGSSSKSIQ
jgi:hypothetical protein